MAEGSEMEGSSTPSSDSNELSFDSDDSLLPLPPSRREIEQKSKTQACPPASSSTDVARTKRLSPIKKDKEKKDMAKEKEDKPKEKEDKEKEEEDKEGEKKKRKTRHMTKEEKEQIEEMTKILRQEILREEKESLWECDLTARFASTPPQAS